MRYPQGASINYEEWITIFKAGIDIKVSLVAKLVFK